MPYSKGKIVFPKNGRNTPVLIYHFQQLNFGCSCIKTNIYAFQFNLLIHACNINLCDISSCFLWRNDTRNINSEHGNPLGSTLLTTEMNSLTVNSQMMPLKWEMKCSDGSVVVRYGKIQSLCSIHTNNAIHPTIHFFNSLMHIINMNHIY